MRVDSSFLLIANTVNSLLVLVLSFLQFKGTILPGPEIYFSMFLAVIALTFNNQINFGSKKLTWAAAIAVFLILVFQVLYFDWGVDLFSTDLVANKMIMLSTAITFLFFMNYLFSSKAGY